MCGEQLRDDRLHENWDLKVFCFVESALLDLSLQCFSWESEDEIVGWRAEIKPELFAENQHERSAAIDAEAGGIQRRRIPEAAQP